MFRKHLAVFILFWFSGKRYQRLRNVSGKTESLINDSRSSTHNTEESEAPKHLKFFIFRSWTMCLDAGCRCKSNKSPNICLALEDGGGGGGVLMIWSPLNDSTRMSGESESLRWLAIGVLVFCSCRPHINECYRRRGIFLQKYITTCCFLYVKIICSTS